MIRTAAIALCLAAALSAHVRPSDAAPGQAAPSVDRPLADGWYDEDEWHLQVRYLMSPREAAEYKRLTSVQARDEFVARFWTRRDPTPDSPPNEFRDEFERRVEYANAHFTDPEDAPHTGVDTERGRIYVLFGAPTSIAKFPKGAHELWRYARLPQGAANLAIEFSVPPIDSCDGSYRVRSPRPLASATNGHTSVEVYPGRLVTARIAVDFTNVASIAHTLRTSTGQPVLEGDAPFWDGRIGPAGKDPLSLHILDCRMFESGSMGFTHPLAAGSYVFSSIVTFLDGSIQRERVPFQVR